MKRIIVYQRSGVEIMYPDLYKGLELKPEDLSKCNTPLWLMPIPLTLQFRQGYGFMLWGQSPLLCLLK